jgi:hypothetical protein
MTEADVFAKLSRLLQTHQLSLDGDEDASEIEDLLSRMGDGASSRGGQPGAAGGAFASPSGRRTHGSRGVSGSPSVSGRSDGRGSRRV